MNPPMAYNANSLRIYPTPYKFFFDALGFTLEVSSEEKGKTLYRLKCPCGQSEYGLIDSHVDPYRHWVDAGSVSPEHLEMDGFSEDVVARARAIFAAAGLDSQKGDD